MNKIYFLLFISALLAGTISTQASNRLPAEQKLSRQVVSRTTPVETSEEISTRSTRGFSSVSEMAGEYTWTYEGHLSGHTGAQSGSVTLRILEETTGECELIGISPFTIKAEALPEDGIFAIPCGQYLGTDEDGDIYFYTKVFDDNGNLLEGTSTAKQCLAFIEEGIIRFMSGDVWAVGDPAHEDLGYYVLSTDNVLTFKNSSGGDEEEWKDAGVATLMDGWLLPAYGIDQLDSKNWYEVTLQQKADGSQVYRLVNPYGEKSPVYSHNECEGDGYIQFDITDPEHVTFATRDAGFKNEELGVSVFYPMNTLSYMAGQYASYGLTLKDLIAIFGNDWPFTTYKDGIIHLTTSPDAQFGWMNDAVFGLQGNPYAGQVWLDFYDQEPDINKRATANMETKIFFPGVLAGVNAIEKDDVSEPEYYTLDGLRIATPTKGMLVIEKRGCKVIKRIF